MSALDWLNGEAFTAFDQHILRSDMAGNLLGLGALALGWRRSLLTWPVQLLSGLVLVAAYASAHLSGGIGKQIVVVTVAVWGWAQWRRGGATKGRLAIRFATWTERAWLVAGTAAGTVALALLFTAYPKLSWDPWPDAYIFVGTLTAMVAQARGWVEFWFAWLAVDVVGVPLAFNNGLAFSGLVYVIYFVLVVLGLRAWWLQTRTDRTPSGTVPDGATA
ncbi:nicotinamide mononucleotide transporter [Streptomyces sp. SID13666]|uniref:nicotinamide mononucleotide transporter family protein n=1 Tax=Streptomyces TaxID=1883 RepID=UPI001106C753|nr:MULTISPECIES: nicotinamide mononucleotide transporter family protein [Streptomyces]MCZ4100555.1 nicotinamide mononucleotide transporter family protein [Streptomyces sp. H39-C1]NEA60044.1 nicotinamide mononucleotide transporter [Streptomyces sp. SID13666]NEA76280.1 nicotinamide mononucleotide transporter [Streptomyces sp. SID13588]QNA72344.1 nicotinamide mononucleotide transporter [Streptomyces sp. So13.3]